MPLKLYGFMASQPTRSVAWLLKLKDVEYEFVKITPQLGEANTPEFRKLNPNGFVPVIEDGDFSLYEGNAILTYLAEKHQWTDVYPANLQTRAKIHQYLNWHHTNARLCTTQVLRPHVMKVYGSASPEHLAFIEKRDEIVTRIVDLVEKMLGDHAFIAETDAPTLADYSAYSEFDQIEALNLFDFSKHAKFHEWMDRMKAIPHHDEVRAELYAFAGAFKVPDSVQNP